MRNHLLAVVLEHFPQKPTRTRGQWSNNARTRAVLKVCHQLALQMMVCFRRDSPELEDGEDLKAVISNPQPSVSEVLRQVHDTGGHFGMHKTLGRLSTRFWWPRYTREVGYSCIHLVSRRSRLAEENAPLQSLHVRGPFEVLTMDLLGP